MFRALERTKTRYAECVKITRTDGVIFRFTAHDRLLRIKESDGVFYEYTPAAAFSLTALEVNDGLTVSNMDIDGIITDDTITEADLHNGIYENARVDIFLAYWSNNRIGILPLRAAWIGDLMVEGPKFQADLRGIANKLAQTFVKATQLECRWTLGDSKCTIDLTTGNGFAREFAISSVTHALDEFVCPIPGSESGNFYQWGYVEFLSGNNNGAKMEIFRQYGQTVKLFLPMSQEIEAGDFIRIVAGCDKKYTTCCSKFDNTRRFGGEPFLSGSDLLTTVPTYGGGSTGSSTGTSTFSAGTTLLDNE
jgi:uncharacterized phage protein (TIGR02218 family)